MKRLILIAAILLASTALWPGQARATEVGNRRMFGLGVQIAEPTALIGKLFLTENNAIDFGFGFGTYGRCYNNDGPYTCGNYHDAYSVHLDFLYEETIVQSVVRLDWHIGAGGRTAFGNAYYGHRGYHDASFFGRVPVGLDLTFRRPCWLEVYLEVAPGLWLYPPLNFDIDIGLGARAYF